MMGKDDTMIGSRLDLNLLKVFDAIYQERSLLKASLRLNLSQSAVSHALSRLRRSVGDDLFVRTVEGMRPTQRAMEMASPLREALRTIHRTVALEAFDPANSTRTFVIAANDYLTSTLLGALVARLGQNAPGIELVIRPATRLDLAQQIDVGRIDLAIGSFRHVPDHLEASVLCQQEEVLLMRSGHPLLALKAIPLVALSDTGLVAVSVGGPEEGAVEGYISERGLARQSDMFGRRHLEKALAEIGRVPKFKLTLPHFLALPDVMCNTDLLAIVPKALANSLCARFTLEHRRLPYTAPPTDLKAVWHCRNSPEPGHGWLREQLQQVLQQTLGQE